MIYHLQKRWCFKFRRDPDAGRVLFVGPLVVSLDVIRGKASKFSHLPPAPKESKQGRVTMMYGSSLYDHVSGYTSDTVIVREPPPVKEGE